jgi:peptidyl-prolyl cis-trans isomerase D
MAAVVGFLVISFAIWGIGDIFRGFGLSTLARIGGSEITIEQFRQQYHDRLQQLARRLGRPITADQARALGLEQQLISQLIAEASLDERARQLKLNLSDAEIARQIMADPNFRGANGRFDRTHFEQLIRNAGYTESRYTAEQRRVSLRRQLVETITGDVKAPRTAIEARNRYENEQRAIDYAVLDRGAAGDIPAPTPEALQKYFDEHKALFRAPEYRKVALLSVAPADLAKSIEVSDADARRVYDDHPDRFGTPERRHVQQMVFPNTEEARGAAERLRAGLSFEALAVERGLKEQDIDLGTIAKSGLVDRAVADAAFSLPAGGVSDPIAGRFGTTLVHVVSIVPAKSQPFEEVAPAIKREIAADRARPQLLTLHDKIEDERAAGSHVDEIAQKLNLTARTIDAVDRSGRGPDGKPIADLPAGADVVASAFATEIGVDNAPLQLPGGGYLWYDVLAITPSRERSLEEVKAEVEARWRDEQIAERLSAKAAEMVDKLKGETPFAEVAAAFGVKAETAFGLKRASRNAALSPKAINEIFRTVKGAPGSAEGNSATERVVFRVVDVVPPSFDPGSAQAKRYGETLARSYVDDLVGQYIARIEADLGISINQEALRRAIAGGGGGDGGGGPIEY